MFLELPSSHLINPRKPIKILGTFVDFTLAKLVSHSPKLIALVPPLFTWLFMQPSNATLTLVQLPLQPSIHPYSHPPLSGRRVHLLLIRLYALHPPAVSINPETETRQPGASSGNPTWPQLPLPKNSDYQEQVTC